MSASREKRTVPGSVSRRSAARASDRIVVVGVQDEEVVAAGESLGGEERVRRAERLLLDREGDGDPPGAPVAPVVVAHDAVLGTDHETDLVATGVGESGEDVVEERPADRDHRLDARVGDGGLSGVERRAVLPPHARAEPAREDHRLSGLRAVTRSFCSAHPEPREQAREPDAGRDEDRDPDRRGRRPTVEEAARAEERGVDEEAAEHPAERGTARCCRATGPTPASARIVVPAGPGGPHEAVEGDERRAVGRRGEERRRRSRRPS